MNKRVLGGYVYGVLFEPNLNDELKKFIVNNIKDVGTSERYLLYDIEEIKGVLQGVEDKQIQEAFEELYKASKEHNFIFIELHNDESN